jgi:hypothetical protein
MALKPETGLMVAAATGVLVYGVFMVNVGSSVADVKSAQPHNGVIQGTVSSAGWESAAIVAGVSLLARDPTVFVVGGAIAACLTWQYKHANLVNPQNGKVTFPPSQGTPQASAQVNTGS